MDGSFVEWLWAPLWVAVFELFRRFFGLNGRVATLEPLADQRLSERLSRLETLEEQRASHHQEVMASVDSHNEAVLSKVGAVETKVDAMVDRVKSNGNRLGTLESHLINRRHED